MCVYIYIYIPSEGQPPSLPKWKIPGAYLAGHLAVVQFKHVYVRCRAFCDVLSVVGNDKWKFWDTNFIVYRLREFLKVVPVNVFSELETFVFSVGCLNRLCICVTRYLIRSYFCPLVLISFCFHCYHCSVFFAPYFAGVHERGSTFVLIRVWEATWIIPKKAAAKSNKCGLYTNSMPAD
jgi:hypothetical protein